MTYLALKSLFKKFKPDIVLSYTSKPIIYSGFAIGKKSKIKFFPNLTGPVMDLLNNFNSKENN